MGKINKNRQQMAEMRANGATYKQIGEEYGITKQAVQSLLKRERTGDKHRPYRVHVNTVYPVLGAWLYSKMINTQKFAEMMDVSYSTGRNLLQGKTPFKIAQIRAVLEMTGMDFNEVFGEVAPNAE